MSSLCTAPDCDQLWIGLESGTLLAVRFRVNLQEQSLNVVRNTTSSGEVALYGHRERVSSGLYRSTLCGCFNPLAIIQVSCISMCPEFGVVATSSGPDVFLWNLESRKFIRKIVEERFPSRRPRVTKARSGPAAATSGNQESGGDSCSSSDLCGKPRSKSETFIYPDKEDSASSLLRERSWEQVGGGARTSNKKKQQQRHS